MVASGALYNQCWITRTTRRAGTVYIYTVKHSLSGEEITAIGEPQAIRISQLLDMYFQMEKFYPCGECE